MKPKSVNITINVFGSKGTYLVISGRILHLQSVENRGENFKKNFHLCWRLVTEDQNNWLIVNFTTQHSVHQLCVTSQFV